MTRTTTITGPPGWACRPTRRRWLGAAGALAAPWPWAGQAAEPPLRVAVVVGNARYAESALRNPARDARAMAALLTTCGFKVIEEVDATRERMFSAVERAAAVLRGRRGVAMLYYAGHGIQIDWRNYLLPVDVRLERGADVARQCVDVQEVLAAFRGAAARTNIVILDACRDNPFGSGGLRGLAPMDAPPGTFYAYATAPGAVAEDGSEAEGNGLYTRFLLGELPRPGSPIEDVFKRVRLRVRQATQGRQIPWESTSLEEDFVFATGERLAAPTPGEREREFEAQRADWERIRASTRAADFFAFLQRHPAGPYAELAQFTLDRLVRPAVLAQAPQSLLNVTMLPPGTDRYRVGDSWTMQRVNHLAGDTVVRIASRVTAIEGGRVIVNDGAVAYDQMGSVLVDRTGIKEPGVLAAPADLSVGKRWRTAFTNTPQGGLPRMAYYDMRCDSLEAITVPAGRFHAFKIIGEGRSVGEQADVASLHTTVWVDPETMTRVRSTLRRVGPVRGRDSHDTDSLVERHRVPR